MAKKRERRNAVASEPSDNRSRIIKVLVSDQETKQIRVAAALEDMAVAEFVRTAALEKAANVVRSNFPPQ